MKKWIACLLTLVLAACGGASNPTPLPPTSEPVTQQQPLFYYTFAQDTNVVPDGSVVIVPDQITLIPTSVPVPRSENIADNIETSLQAMMKDEHNLWTSSDLAVDDVTFDKGLATVKLSGTISGAGGAVLSAASTQILLTVFSDPAVESALITLNDDTISNLGIENSSQAKAADTVYIRADVARIIEGG